MIARLTGHLHTLTLESVIIDVQGVGYKVDVPVGTQARLESDGDGRVSVLIHTAVREDAIQLFGFATEAEKTIFQRLIGVSGIGPRLGLACLSDLGPKEIVRAIHSSDVDTLKQVSGIGKKTAQRLILELKSSMDDLDFAQLAPAAQDGVGDGLAIHEDLRSALGNLGYDANSVDAAIAQLDEGLVDDANFDILLREALKVLR